MRAIVLAAGKGERLKDITVKTPKPMLEVDNEVILEHNLKWLRDNGVVDISINLHYLPEVITDYFGDGSGIGIKIEYFFEENILGTSGSVENIAKNWNEPFLVIYGDNFFPKDFNLKNFIDFHKRHAGVATLGLYDNKSEIAKSGIVITDQDHRIQEFIEKPDLSENSIIDVKTRSLIMKKGLINAGVYLLESGVMDYLAKGFSDFGNDIFPELMANNEKMFGYLFKGQIIAVDTVELYNRMKK